MNRATWKFLKKCEKYKLKRVCIGVVHPIVPTSLEFPYGAEGCVFAISTPKGGSDHDGWPAIWQVIRDLELKEGCGGPNHSQADISGLDRGAYRFYAGKWKKLQE